MKLSAMDGYEEMKMKQTVKKVSLVIFVGGLAAACAHPPVVNVVKPADRDLTCAQIINEIDDLEQGIIAAKKEKGWTGGNIARGLLFWPAILGTHNNVNEAVAAAESRIVHLEHIKVEKECVGAS